MKNKNESNLKPKRRYSKISINNPDDNTKDNACVIEENTNNNDATNSNTSTFKLTPNINIDSISNILKNQIKKEKISDLNLFRIENSEIKSTKLKNNSNISTISYKKENNTQNRRKSSYIDVNNIQKSEKKKKKVTFRRNFIDFVDIESFKKHNFKMCYSEVDDNDFETKGNCCKKLCLIT